MNKSAYVHLRNKYPGASVHHDDNCLQVEKDGELLVSVRKVSGVWECQQKQDGARDAFSLEPIPKECRHTKLYANGQIGKDDEHAARLPKAREVAKQNGGRVPSIRELDEQEKAAKAKASQQQ